MNIVCKKSLQYQDGRVAWCPSMDILAVVSSSQKQVSLFRCGQQKFESIGHVQNDVDNESPPTSFAFADHGKFCAIGYQDGSLVIRKTDSGAKLFEYELIDQVSGAAGAILSISWKAEGLKRERALQNYDPLDFEKHIQSLREIEPKLSQ